MEPARLSFGKPVAVTVWKSYMTAVFTRLAGLKSFGYAVAHVIKPGSPRLL